MAHLQARLSCFLHNKGPCRHQKQPQCCHGKHIFDLTSTTATNYLHTLTHTSKNPDCTCHPSSPKPKPNAAPIQAVLQGREPNQTRALNQPNAEFDIECDMATHDMKLCETVGDPTYISTATQYTVHLDLRNSRLLNIQGQDDNSLLVTLEMRPEACAVPGHGLRLETKVWSFQPAYIESKLHEAFYQCSWERIVLRLALPQSRIHGFKTVAMFLVTFGKLKWDAWAGMVQMQNSSCVAGFDWVDFQQQVKSEVRRAQEKMKVWDDEGWQVYP